MGSPYVMPNPEHLLEEEVDFDLKLRGQTVDRRETLEDKKRFLRRLYLEGKKEKTVIKGRHRFKDELATIEEKVTVIVDELDKKFDHALVSRLRHYLIRAHTAVVKEESEKQNRKEICRQIEQILNECGQKVREEVEVGQKEDDKEETEEDKGTDKDEKGEKTEDDKGTDKEEKAEKTEDDKGTDKDTEDRKKKFEAEWIEFKLWKLRQRNKSKDETEENDSSSEDGRPPKSTKSRKSRNNHGKNDRKKEKVDSKRSSTGTKSRSSRNDYDDSETDESSDERPPESSKSRKSQKEIKGRFKSERRSPESHKSRKSRKDKSLERKSREKSKRYSSESSSDRPRKSESRGRSKDSSQSDSSSEYDSKSRKKGRKQGRRHQRCASSSSEQEKPRYRKSRVENWDLNFSGDSRSMQVEDFLSRIQKLARHEGVSKDELLMNIHRRLKGEAYDWWFTRESHLTSWKKFENEIRFRYGNPNRDRGIRAQIRELKQKKGETFIAYVTEVEKLNQCLQRPFSTRTLFELIWENMRPYYRSRLSVLDIDDLESLIEINHKIDANDPSFFKPSPSNRNELHHLDVEDSFGDDSEEAAVVNNLSTNKGNSRRPGPNNTQQTSSQQQRSDNVSRQQQQEQQAQSNARTALTCWNCKRAGHAWRDCQGPKQIFCYLCGNPGKTTRNCERNHPSFGRRGTQNAARPTN